MAIPTGDDRSRLYEKERRVGWAFLLIWFADSIGYRGENAGAARPRLRQRAKRGSRTAASLDSLHLIRGVGAKAMPWPFRNSEGLLFARPRSATLGYTERPARVQFMLGRVGLYTTNVSYFARQQVEPALPAGCTREAE